VGLEKDKTACPRCGKLVIPRSLYGDAFPHHCTPLEERVLKLRSESESTTGYSFEPEDAQRIADCPKCHNKIDVSRFDPLEHIHCGFCNAAFDLLRIFNGYEILRPYNAGWHNAVYLAKNAKSGELFILKVLSAHVLSQPDALIQFQSEGERVRQLFKEEYSKHFTSGNFHGFHYFLIPLGDLPEETALHASGAVTMPVRKVDPTPKKRAIACTRCEKVLDLTHHNPLDHISCPDCGNTFELYRHFGNYRIDYRLTTGGSSLLYLAHNAAIQRDVALKVLNCEEMNHGQECVDQFLKECELTAKLIHPNIVQVYDTGEFQGYFYMAMELVEGLTIDDILTSIQETGAIATGPLFDPKSGRQRFKEALPELVSLEIILQAASGLELAHRQGLIHGDVKPNNIMLTYEGMVKVLDFGLLQFANAEKVFQDAEANAIHGTPIYIPPERVRMEPEDFRSDIYGLGATLYHMLRGVPPFTGKSAVEIALKQVNAPVVPFRAFAPWVSEQTCRIVEKSLKKQVQERYQSHLEFISDLTLAKNQILNSMSSKPLDGKTLLKIFMQSVPMRASSRAWKRAETGAVRTYKYVTNAIGRLKPRPLLGE
jgi:serine/threonine protein kinase